MATHHAKNTCFVFKCMHIMHHYTLIHFITSTDGMLIVNNKAPKNKYAEDTV